MSILDTFYILFKADTTDLKKGQQDAFKTTKELQDKIKNTNSDAQDLASSFVDMAQKAAGFIGVALGVGAAINGIMQAEKGALTIGFFSDSTGVAVGRVDALTQAVGRFGGTLAGTMNTIQTIQQGLTFLSPLGGAAGVMPTQFALTARQFGIRAAPGMNVQQVMDELHNKFKNQPANVNAKIGAALGIDPATIRLLQSSDETYKKIMADVKAIGLLTEENTKAAEEFYSKWGDINQAVRQVELTIGTAVLNYMNQWYDYIQKNKDAFLDLWEAAKLVGIAVGVIGAALLLATITVSGPLLIVLGIILAIGLAIAAVWAVIHYGKQILADIGALFVSAFGEARKWVGGLIDDVKALWGWLQKGIQGFEDLWRSKNKPDAAGQAQIDQYKSQEDQLRAARAAIHGANANPFSSTTTGGSSRSSATSITISKVEVHTQATDSDGIAGAIGDHLEKHINNAINNFNTGVLA